MTYAPDMPQWYWEQVSKMEQELTDGWISFTEFNSALTDMETIVEAQKKARNYGYVPEF